MNLPETDKSRSSVSALPKTPNNGFQLFSPETEVWKTHPLHSDYMVSSQGRVLSLRNGRSGVQPKNKDGLLSPNLDPKDYPQVDISGSPKRIHNLVLETFIGPRPKGMVCCHFNDIGIDNRVWNLGWGTRENNKIDDDFNKAPVDDDTSTMNVKRVYRDHKEIVERACLEDLAANKGSKYKEQYLGTPVFLDAAKPSTNSEE
jgi:hypothetical protein